MASATLTMAPTRLGTPIEISPMEVMSFDRAVEQSRKRVNDIMKNIDGGGWGEDDVIAELVQEARAITRVVMAARISDRDKKKLEEGFAIRASLCSSLTRPTGI